MRDDLPTPPPLPHVRPPVGATATASPPISRLAVAAFVLGLAGLCPLAGLPAIVVGFVAHARIVRGATPRRGRGFALWGIALGSATSLAWLGLWGHVGTRMLDVLSTRMEASVVTVVEAAAAGDSRAVAAALDGPAIDEAAIEAFVHQVGIDGLEADRVAIGRFEQVDGGLVPLVEADVRWWTADGGLWNGEATFRLRPSAFRGWSIEGFAAEPRLVSLHLRGPDGRSIRYPVPMPGPAIDPEPTSVPGDSESVPPGAVPPIRP